MPALVDVSGTIGSVTVRQRAPISRYASQLEVSHGLAERPSVDGVDQQQIPRPEVTVFGAAGGAYELGPIAVHGAAGIELRTWRRFRALVEYNRTFTSTSFQIPHGTARFRANSDHVVSGFGIHF